jgi:hypothetical protein
MPVSWASTIAVADEFGMASVRENTYSQGATDCGYLSLEKAVLSTSKYEKELSAFAWSNRLAFCRTRSRRATNLEV